MQSSDFDAPEAVTADEQTRVIPNPSYSTWPLRRAVDVRFTLGQGILY